MLGNSSPPPQEFYFWISNAEKNIYIHINTMSVLMYSLYVRVPDWKSPATEWKHNRMHFYHTIVFINKQEHLTIFSTLWTSKPLKR